MTAPSPLDPLRMLLVRSGLVLGILTLGGSAAAGTDAAEVTLGREELIDRVLERSGELAGLRERAERGTRPFAGAPYPANPVLAVELEGSQGPWSGRNYTRKLSLEQEIDVRGERGARRDAFVAGGGLLREELRAREQAIAADVDEAVSGWLIARRRLELLGPALHQARSLRQRAQTARRRELITPFNERMLRADALEVEGEMSEARQQLEQMESRLQAWLGSIPDSLRIEEPLSADAWRCDGDSIVGLALSHRADLARAQAAELQAVARQELARRLGRVNPTLGLSIGQERLEIDAFPEPLEDKDVFIGVHGSIPLPLSETNRLERLETRLELDRSRSERVAIELQIRGEVAAACAALARAQERVDLLAPLAESAGSDLRVLEAAYRDGRAALDEYLTLRERLLRAQRGSVDALADLEEARSALVRATGLRRPALFRSSGP